MAFQNGQIVKSEDLLSFLLPGIGEGGGQGHSLRHNTCCLISWKRGIKMGRLAWHHPLRLWRVQEQWADIRMPRLGYILTFCHFSL